jgi:hypothetical protein
MPIGPSLPPHLAHLAGSSSRSPSPPTKVAPLSDDEGDNDYGPGLPPHLAAARQAGPARPPPAAFPSGPALPSRATAADEEDSDDDVIGPKPVPSGVVEERSAVQAFLEREARWAKEREVSSSSVLFIKRDRQGAGSEQTEEAREGGMDARPSLLWTTRLRYVSLPTILSGFFPKR